MENFGLNSAKSFLGKNVNLHLKDGSVIVNVQLTGVRRGDFGKGNFVEFVPCGNYKIGKISLKNVAWAEALNMNFLQSAS